MIHSTGTQSAVMVLGTPYMAQYERGPWAALDITRGDLWNAVIDHLAVLESRARRWSVGQELMNQKLYPYNVPLCTLIFR